MSFKQSSNSLYGNDSVNEIPDSLISEDSNNNKLNEIDSSGSSIDLSVSKSDTDINSLESSDSKELIETNSSPEIAESLWTASNVSSNDSFINNKHKKHENCKSCNEPNVLPSKVSPFVYDGRSIRYNSERGVEYKTPVIFGSRKITGTEDQCGYHASHFIFDPSSGSLAAGYDIDNGWSKLPNFSLITGVGNSSDLDASFVSGSHNKIKLAALTSGSNNDEFVPPSCSIIGGSNNIIANNSASKSSSSIISSHGVNVHDSEATVVLGMIARENEAPFTKFKESTITRNLYSFGHSHVGPLFTHLSPADTIFSVNGDSYIEGNLSVTGHINSDSATIRTLVATNASFQNISASNVSQNSVYLEGISGNTGIDITLIKGDGVNVIYANPAPGDVRIQLGTSTNPAFESNRQLLIKDASLEFGPGSSNNIYVWTPAGIRIEYYGTGITGGIYGMTASEGGIYILNTSGGSVTFRYLNSVIPGSLPTWVIENQLIGNSRLLPSTGVRFTPTDDNNKTLLLRRQ